MPLRWRLSRILPGNQWMHCFLHILIPTSSVMAHDAVVDETEEDDREGADGDAAG